MPVMSFRFPVYLSTHGAPSRACRLVLAFRAVSIDAVGCQKARSGLSPVATLVWIPCSYGSGIVTTFTVAPVSFSKPATTLSGVLLEFWAAQMVRVRSEEHTSELQSRQYLVCRL